MSRLRGIAVLVAFAALVLHGGTATAQESCVNVQTGEPVGCGELGAVSQEVYEESTLRDNCVHVRTGEPLGCGEAGAVTQEVYDQSPLRDGDEPSDEGDGLSVVPVAVGVGVVVVVLALLLALRRRRRNAGRAGTSPVPTESSATSPAPAVEPVAERPPAAAERTEPAPIPPPMVAAGWYPDPDQVKTQRYWTGTEWTEQRAPLEEPKAASGLRFGVILTLLGCLVTAVGVFLPWVDTPGLIPVQDNSLIQGGYGWVPLIAAIGVAGSALAAKSYRPAAIVGLLIIGYAVFMGTGDRLELEYVGPGEFADTFDESMNGNPGVGLYVVGVGGLLIALGSIIED